MKTIFKILFGLIIFVVLLIGVPFAILYFSIHDNTDDTPLALYTESVTMETELNTLFDEGFDLEDKEYLNLTFTEDNLNKLIFAMVKDSMNSDYNPNKAGATDDNKYIDYMEFEVPVLGVQKVLIKSLYADISNDQLHLYMPMTLFGINTRAKMSLKFDETDELFIFDFESLGLGKADLLKGFASDLAFNILEKLDFSTEKINQELESKGIPIAFDLQNFALEVKKSELNDLVGNVIETDEMEESNEKNMISELLSLLTRKENDIAQIGVFADTFGIRFDLTKFAVSETITTLSDDIKTFDRNSFVQYKTQGYVISSLNNPTGSKITFSNLEFNQIIYDYSDGFENFKFNFPIPGSTSDMSLEIIGILIDFNAVDVDIRVNINLNGMITSIKLNGLLDQTDDQEIVIMIDDDITIGEDLDEEVGEYLLASSNLLMGMLGDNMAELGVMSYSSTLKAFIIKAESFEKMMAVDGENVTPLEVSKIKIVDNRLDVYATVPGGSLLSVALLGAVNDVQNALSTNNFTENDFDTTDSQQQEAVNNLLDTLDTVSLAISNGTLSEAENEQLLNDINQLSPENRDAFLNGLETASGSSDLLGLYDSLFGN